MAVNQLCSWAQQEVENPTPPPKHTERQRQWTLVLACVESEKWICEFVNNNKHKRLKHSEVQLGPVWPVSGRFQDSNPKYQISEADSESFSTVAFHSGHLVKL